MMSLLQLYAQSHVARSDRHDIPEAVHEMVMQEYLMVLRRGHT